jgi:hypothetical protein
MPARKKHKDQTGELQFFVMLSVSFFLMCSIERPSTPTAKNSAGRYGSKIFNALSNEPVQGPAADR